MPADMSTTLEADSVVETFSCATEENQVSPLRQGQVVELPAEGEVWMTGDIHDHRRNFEKFIGAADLANNPQRHIVLHELIHGDHYDADGAEDSWQMLHQAARLKCDFPDQVHFLLANHDLAQIHGEGIMKAGLSVCEAFNTGVKRDFKDQRGTVQRRDHRIPAVAAAGDPMPQRPVLLPQPADRRSDRDVRLHASSTARSTGDDYKRRTGPVYQLIWGRNIDPGRRRGVRRRSAPR